MASTKFRTTNDKPNQKTLVGTALAFLVPTVAAWLAQRYGVVVGVDAIEAVLGGLLTSALVFIGEYMKRPGKGDGIKPEGTRKAHAL